MSIHPFGQLADGTTIFEIRLKNLAGVAASIITFGAALRDLVIPMGSGSPRHVVLGFESLEGYLENNRFIGVVCGRHASRINRGRLPIDGKVHQLSLNDGIHHLHGGSMGFSRKVWTIISSDETSVTLGLVSPDGDNGYPGSLDVRLTYRLGEPADVSVSITASTDAPTFVSICHHPYFTLNPGKPVGDHRLRIEASRYTPLGPDLLPTGEIADVSGTALDFRTLRRIADPDRDPDLVYDNNFVLDNRKPEPTLAARLEAPDNRLAMNLLTSEPCLVLYDGSGLAPDWPGIGGSAHFPGAGVCLEPMRFIDSANVPSFPSTRLNPGERYRYETKYRFSS